MKILMAASEVYPFSKTGGLADVLGALPQALTKRGHEVLVVSPWYADLRSEPQPLWIGDVEVPFDGSMEPVGIGTLEKDGVRYVFIGHASFQRERMYGYPDDVRRFALLTRAIPPAADRVNFLPDVVHTHDWHVGYLPAVLHHGWHLPSGWPGLPSVFTIHNVQHQGVSGLDEATYWLRLPNSVQESGMQHFGAANAMQAALDFAERVTTVSPSYAEEIKLPSYGFGLDGTFRHISAKLSGILNGLDDTVWDPANDPYLEETYDASELRGKWRAKHDFETSHALNAGRPLLGIVSRFAEQKGIDLLLEAAPGLLEDGWSLAVLGAGEHALEQDMLHLATLHPSRVAVRLGYDEAHAHRIYAAADALAIPSRFEPCGLTQLIAMRYGTLPVARATGGLRDTIRPGVTGFLFGAASPQALRAAASEALDALQDEGIDNMRRTAMRERFDWQRAAEAYGEVYLAARGDAS